MVGELKVLPAPLEWCDLLSFPSYCFAKLGTKPSQREAKLRGTLKHFPDNSITPSLSYFYSKKKHGTTSPFESVTDLIL
jgi:hypothetical protein